ncbi:YxlC family protein [Paenibacillus sp. 19GGS1-52]|uniref:YxlC family protein n=1 Tax=Paenibacillus sp. 19GGS1-52 TaxID=2758563 RepID=UPI001EFAC83A|nr:YxlC family protein [Paenibacillus sp. 19GGS1-52]ULO08283.1 YxlC family protein [Paenibacillus sp. 19GGS1-52]
MENEQDQELFLQKLTGELHRLDAQFDDINAPSLQELERFLVAETVRSNRQARKELLLFWLISLILLSSCLAVLSSAPAIYWVVQALIPVVGLSGLAGAYIRRRREGAED